MTVVATRNVVVKTAVWWPNGTLTYTFSSWEAWALQGSLCAPEYTPDDGGDGARGESSRTQTQGRLGLISRRFFGRATSTRFQLSTLDTMY